MSATINNVKYEVLGKSSEDVFITYCYSIREIDYFPVYSKQIKETLELSLKDADPIQQMRLLNNTNFFPLSREEIAHYGGPTFRNHKVIKYTQAILDQHPNNKILERFAKYYYKKYEIHKQR